MNVDDPQVCVIVAAKDAAATIGAAVRSALAEPEVCEVILVDDASRDGTAAAARAASGGDPRLRILEQETNSGPAAARNAALEATSAPYVAILDGDDAILPGRFRTLLGCGNWDFVADNILFVAEDADGHLDLPADTVQPAPAEPLSLSAFVAGNISDGLRERGEMGFLKPLIRRDFLQQNGLRYAPEMRLGEDFDLYARALLAGARFGVTRQVGYVARTRSNSLSAQHRAADLKALLDACDGHLRAAPSEPALWRHRAQVRRRYLLRACLDVKRDHGLAGALRFALSPPANLPPIVRGVAADKLALMRAPQGLSPVGRTLLPR